MDKNDFTQAYCELLLKSWNDEDLKTALINDPMKVFRDYEIDVPEGIEFKVMENTDKVVHLPLPLRPTEEVVRELERYNHSASGGGGPTPDKPINWGKIIMLFLGPPLY